MTHSKMFSKTFVANNEIVGVYNNDNNNQLNKFCDLPALKNKNGDKINPFKMLMQ